MGLIVLSYGSDNNDQERTCLLEREMKKRSAASAATQAHNTRAKRVPVKRRSSTNMEPDDALATASSMLPSLNDYAVIMMCWSCGMKTAVYGQADLDMWDDERLLYPPCARCGTTLIRDRVQYRELS